MNLLHRIAIRSNLEMKTQPKQLLGSLPLDIKLPEQADTEMCAQNFQP